MRPQLVLIAATALVLTQIGFADEPVASNPKLARQWQQRAKAAIAAMDEELVNERELAAGRLVTPMVNTGEVDAAVALANSMTTSRINVLLNIANQLVAAGKHDEARRVVSVIEDALETARADKEYPTSMFAENLRSLVGIHAGLGDFKQARQTVSRITAEMDRSSLHITMKGPVRLPDGRLRAESLWEIAMNEIQRGDVEAAKRTIGEIKLRLVREAALWSMVKGLAQIGRTADALAFAREIPACELAGEVYLFTSSEGPEERSVGSFRTDAYDTVALEQAEAKDLKAANATLRLIPQERHPLVLQAMARSLIDLDAYSEALEVASWQPDDELTQWVLAGTARRQAETSDLSAAVATARQISFKPQRAVALMAIADRQMQGQDEMAVRQSVEELRTVIADAPATIKLEVLLACSRLLAGCGDRTGALQRLSEVVELIKAVPEADERQPWWLAVAIGYGIADDPDKAEAATARMDAPGMAAHAWVEIAKCQAARGQRAAALASLNKALEKAKSIDFAAPLDWSPGKPHNLRDIGGAMIALDMVPELEAMIESEKNSLVKAYLCLGAAESFQPAPNESAAPDREKSLARPISGQ